MKTRIGMKAKAIGLYVASALLVSWIAQVAAIRTWGLENDATRVVFVGVMWSPTLLALAFIAALPTARHGVRWRLGHPAYLPLGIAVETAIAFAVVGILVAAGLATSGWFAFSIGIVQVVGGPWLLGHGVQSWPIYIANIAVTAVVYATVGLVAATGEEFAWRGFLQPHLERFGVLRALLLVAAIWWAWHLPGLLAGYNFPAYPYLGAFVLFPLQMVGSSLFFGWLALRAKSFWPAALAHATVNSTQQGLLDNLQLATPQLVVDALRTGLIVLVGLACGAALMIDQRAEGTRRRSGGQGCR
jgi:uncharacterized protein